MNEYYHSNAFLRFEIDRNTSRKHSNCSREYYLHSNFDNSKPIALILVYRRLLLVLKEMSERKKVMPIRCGGKCK